MGNEVRHWECVAYFLPPPTFLLFAKKTPFQGWHDINKNNKGEGLEGKGK